MPPDRPTDRPQHPSSLDLARFLEGSLPRFRNREIVRHLLTGCSRCAAEAGRLQVPTLPGPQPNTRNTRR